MLSQAQAFFFKEERPFGMALVRMTLPLVLLTLVIPRWFFVRELYSTDGSIAQVGTGFGQPNFLPELSPAWAVALYSLEVLFLIGACIGWQTRICLVGSTILFNYFCMLDVLGTVSKLTVIAGHGLLLLSVSAAGEVWSVDAWLKRRRQARGLTFVEREGRFPIWAQRLLQILIAVIYFSAAITKVNTPAYFSGDQMMYWLVTNINGPKPVGEFLTEYPAFLVVSSYVGFVWEVMFIFFCWRPVGRYFALGMGALFHFGTFVMLGLQSFPMVMFSLYLCYLSEEDVQWCMSRLRRMSRRTHSAWLKFAALGPRGDRAVFAGTRITPAMSLMSFCTLAAGTAALGIVAERGLDLYQKQNAEGGYALKEIEPERLKVLLGEPEPLRDVDKVFGFEVGTLEVGGKLWDRCKEFHQGDRLICEVSLNPPREDQWFECALVDFRGRTVSRPGDTAPRENLRMFFTFNLAEDIEPGEYAVVLYSKGEEVIRRSFRIVGESFEAVEPLAN